jgi:hypothetical protein
MNKKLKPKNKPTVNNMSSKNIADPIQDPNKIII